MTPKLQTLIGVVQIKWQSAQFQMSQNLEKILRLEEERYSSLDLWTFFGFRSKRQSKRWIKLFLQIDFYRMKLTNQIDFKSTLSIPNSAAKPANSLPKARDIVIIVPADCFRFAGTCCGAYIMQRVAICPLVKPHSSKFKKINQSEWNSQAGVEYGADTKRIVKMKISLNLDPSYLKKMPVQSVLGPRSK